MPTSRNTYSLHSGCPQGTLLTGDAPWQSPLTNHPRIRTITPPEKKQRENYKKEISNTINSLLTKHNTLVISTDGSRRRIRGTKKTGAGVVIKHGNNIVSKHSYGVGRKTNAYDGESIALLAGMRLATQYCKDNPHISTIHFFSDSSSAITNILNTKAHPTQTVSCAFSNCAEDFLKNEHHQIVLQWIPGHAGLDINEQADRLARRGCKRDQEIIPTSLSYHAERRSTLSQKLWRRDLLTKPLTGAFGDVTLEPPTTKPSKVFLQLKDDPEVFGRLTQLRTMHGYNPHYYARFNIPHDPDCICGNRLRPFPASRYRDHILHNCYEYDDHRHLLSAASRDHHDWILLGRTKGLLATAKFLKASGAMTATGKPYERPATPPMPELHLLDPT
jgi:ribonuclease HI